MRNWLLIALGWIVNKFYPFPTEEYCRRFVEPHVRRAVNAGLSDYEIEQLWHNALELSDDPTIVGGGPAAIFARMIDEVERMNVRRGQDA